MSNGRPGTGLFIAAATGLALMAFAGGDAAVLPSSPVDPRRIWQAYGPVRRAYPKVLDPEDVMLFFTEYRIDQWGPPGSTRMWTTFEQIHVTGSAAEAQQRLVELPLVRVHVRPKWLKNGEYELEDSDEVVAVWVNPRHLKAVGPSKHIDLARRAILAELWFANGSSLDIIETLSTARKLFPAVEHWTTRAR